MWKFFAGLLLGFVLGTAYPNEVRKVAKIFIAKTLQILQSVEHKLQEAPTSKQDDNNTKIFDEVYNPQEFFGYRIKGD